MTPFDDILKLVLTGQTLSADDMSLSVTAMMDGTVSERPMKDFLVALHSRGETADEIFGAARVLRSKAAMIHAGDTVVDCCGTGGDGAHTYNISTAVAIVAAACGVNIAKHGNRAASSKCGAADVLEKLGVTLALSQPTLERALSDIGFCFLMAPRHHAAMKHIAPVRKSLPHPTVFNLLGPLANPAGADIQLMGVYDSKWVMPVAHALQSLGTKRAIVVHGQDGLDEITLCAPTDIAILDNGIITPKTLHPSDFGLGIINANDIKGGDADTNAAALLALLNGEKNAYRDMVLANTSAVLHLRFGTSLLDGVKTAAVAIDDGKALNILNRYKALTA